ncbi:CD3324 family protein [Vagococcus fluvialis]
MKKDIRRAKSMEYKKAEEILPKELLKEIQNYIQGATLYIPKETHHEWGEKSGIKDKLHKRNQLIKEKFQQGNSIQSLANDFYLSEETIKKIVYKK